VAPVNTNRTYIMLVICVAYIRNPNRTDEPGTGNPNFDSRINAERKLTLIMY
jgi:hypothetical protein